MHLIAIASISAWTRLHLTLLLLLRALYSRFAEAAGINRDWPQNRSVFFNSDNSLVVWINAEDHVQVLATHAGSDVTVPMQLVQKVRIVC
jgi:hypothetical protein